ncbi:hypothetical protein [Paenibacillus sp. UNC451MF]|uniref:hypothetical protein n=1 Tax=Paenibacillus sp. UNC451MF TaxID=1449063 RepID=UPI00048F1339|nr:hypothetical protein [Paenibacillus sp. UNC451MF]
MYDYISIHSSDYTKKVKSGYLEKYLISNLGFEKDRHLTFCKELHGDRICLRGLPADLDGNYAIYTLDGVEEINLIEIDLPRNISGILEHAIASIAIAIAKEFSWIIDDEEAAEKFKQKGRPDLAELYVLAEELRNQN